MIQHSPLLAQTPRNGAARRESRVLLPEPLLLLLLLLLLGQFPAGLTTPQPVEEAGLLGAALASPAVVWQKNASASCAF
jgi:hypothetical protein